MRIRRNIQIIIVEMLETTQKYRARQGGLITGLAPGSKLLYYIYRMGWDEPLSDCQFCNKKTLIRPNLIGQASQKSTRGIRQILREICLMRDLYKIAAILTSFHYNRHITLDFRNTSNCVQKVLGQQNMCFE